MANEQIEQLKTAQAQLAKMVPVCRQMRQVLEPMAQACGASEFPVLQDVGKATLETIDAFARLAAALTRAIDHSEVLQETLIDRD